MDTATAATKNPTARQKQSRRLALAEKILEGMDADELETLSDKAKRRLREVKRANRHRLLVRQQEQRRREREMKAVPIKKTAMTSIQKIARDAGLSVTVLPTGNPPRKGGRLAGCLPFPSPGRSPAACRKQYVHPADPGLRWTGRGRRPDWVKQWVAEGKSLDACLRPSGDPAVGAPEVPEPPEC